MDLDILRCVDMKGTTMLRLFKRTKELAVEFCDRCGRVCDASCRAIAIREQAATRALRLGPRF
jgi:hypothetical protein